MGFLLIFSRPFTIFVDTFIDFTEMVQKEVLNLIEYLHLLLEVIGGSFLGLLIHFFPLRV